MMELLLGFSITAFIVVVTVDTSNNAARTGKCLPIDKNE